MKRFTFFLGLGIALILGTAVWATVPKLINFQGILKDGSGNPVADASYSVTFTIYNAPAGGFNLWTETQSVNTTGGLFAVLLGASNPVPDSVFQSSDRWLGIAVSPDPEMAVRQQLVSVGYAYRVNSVDSASGGTITSKVSIGPGHTNTGINAFVAGANNAGGGHFSAIGGGQSNTTGSAYTTISGGYGNIASESAAVVGGGYYNTSNLFATVGGGYSNTASGGSATVGGGSYNRARGHNSVVAGGGAGGSDSNSTIGNFSAIGGGCTNVANGAWSIVGGGRHNKTHGQFSVVSGGGGAFPADSNSALGDYSSIGGGHGNTASGNSATVSGGEVNLASGNNTTVGGGNGNTASNTAATVGGGFVNAAIGAGTTVGGGYNNTASNFFATVGGGERDTASGLYSVVPGGFGNKASGFYSLAAGRRAKAIHAGAFVWADSNNIDFASTANAQFNVRASGGTRIYSNSALTAGVTLAAGASAWVAVSDSNMKRNIRTLDGRQMLDKIMQLPIKRWSYKSQDPKIEHIGPMAQDFYPLFEVGEDPLKISTIDPPGIALAAIQGLYKMLEELKAENEELRGELKDLRELVQKLLAEMGEKSAKGLTSTR